MDKTQKTKKNSELLTHQEKAMIKTILGLFQSFESIVTNEERHLFAKMHLSALETMIMANATARAYPDRFSVL